jgi:hypothetical protein
MFATTFYLEREPLSLADLPGMIQTWVQNAGAVAALLLLILWLVEHRLKESRVIRNNPLAVILSGLAALAYAAWILVLPFVPATTSNFKANLSDYLLTAGGAFALLAVLTPIVWSCLTRMRWGRIWAMARVSFKEAVRKRVVVVFSMIALIFLFATWFVQHKEEDQIRSYVHMVYLSISILFLLTASLLGAFSIPNDVKNQSIHTIVTKPVEKFEIVLGRFLGYGLLLTSGLAVIACLSLIYIVRGVNPEAAYESQKARVPLYGILEFWDTETGTSMSRSRGVSVGREWEYRSYISGPQPNQKKTGNNYAKWSYLDLPAELGERDGEVIFEFTFDIFRLNKGTEGKGIFCTFLFTDGRLNLLEAEKSLAHFREERTQMQADLTKKAMSKEERQSAFAKINETLIKKYGIVEVAGKEITDGHTQSLTVPAVFFERLNELEKEKPREFQPGLGRVPMMSVLVSVDSTSPQQMLGAAYRDFYLLADDRGFELNFFKGILGIWFVLMLVLGVSIACSTYLSGVISWILTMFLVLIGLFTEFPRQLAEGRTPGGGPAEAFYRMATRSPQAAYIEPGPTATIISTIDDRARWGLRLFLHLVPDITRYDLHPYVANGFDIPWLRVLFVDNFLTLAGYLLPWAILAFYMMKFREIANPT